MIFILFLKHCKIVIRIVFIKNEVTEITINSANIEKIVMKCQVCCEIKCAIK